MHSPLLGTLLSGLLCPAWYICAGTIVFLLTINSAGHAQPHQYSYSAGLHPRLFSTHLTSISHWLARASAAAISLWQFGQDSLTCSKPARRTNPAFQADSILLKPYLPQLPSNTRQPINLPHPI